jgi:hypothetical protein
MKTFVRCGQLFTGREDEAQKDAALVYDEEGRLLYLAYGNAKTEEDIDLYSPMEFRALRGMFFAQKVAASGYTAICSPGDAGQVSLSIRNAINAGLFDGPRVMAAGPYLTTHQGLTDWYPTWIGAPETSIGKLVTTVDEAVQEVRRQVKNGVDCIKIAMDGIQRRPDGELIAAFTQEETDIIVRKRPTSSSARRTAWAKRRCRTRSGARRRSIRRAPESTSSSTAFSSTTNASPR